MAAVQRIDGDLEVSGFLIAGILATSGQVAGALSDGAFSPVASIARSKQALSYRSPYSIPLIDFRVHDAMDTRLAQDSYLADDMGLTAGTFGVSPPCISAGPIQSTSTTRYARVSRAIPPAFDGSYSGITIRVYAGMSGALADTSVSLDVDAYITDATGTLGSQIVSTTAQSMNSLVAATYDFICSPSGIGVGSCLDIRLSIAAVDSATVTDVIPNIYAVDVLIDLRG